MKVTSKELQVSTKLQVTSFCIKITSLKFQVKPGTAISKKWPSHTLKLQLAKVFYEFFTFKVHVIKTFKSC